LEAILSFTSTGAEFDDRGSRNDLIEAPTKTKEQTPMTSTICTSKKYRTVDGRYAQILCTTVVDDSYPVAALVTDEEGNQVVSRYTSSGKYLDDHIPSNNDLIEISPYDDFEVDDKVLVSNTGHTWYKRYFSHVNEEGVPCTFNGGGTSWSQKSDNTNGWEFCKKAED
jgi:hypothetical protein